MNPARGQSASAFLQKIDANKLARVLVENADEPNADILATTLAGKSFATTQSLAKAIRGALPRLSDELRELSVRRVFQAVRIAVNEEFSSLDAFLRVLPSCLNPGGRVAILTFHSGEDRRVKKSFAAGLGSGYYAEISDNVIRPSSEERNANPRSASAKLRWARKT
jgi:16S rRNA (cytosine1402-N4)-methyltransferase